MPAVIKGPRPRTAQGLGSSVESSSIKTKRVQPAKARGAVASSSKPKRKP
jgi:hypothetical protein